MQTYQYASMRGRLKTGRTDFIRTEYFGTLLDDNKRTEFTVEAKLSSLTTRLSRTQDLRRRVVPFETGRCRHSFPVSKISRLYCCLY